MRKRTRILIILLAILALVIVPANAAETTYNVRSSVYDSTDSAIPAGDFYWDANSFTAFWYPIKPGLSSEVLYLHNSMDSSTFQLGDKIVEGDLYYVSKSQKKKTKIGGSDDAGKYIVDDVDLEFYYLTGFFGPQYVVMPEDTANPSKGCRPDKIAKILLETKSDFKKQMYTGEEWKLAGGWSLVAQQIDIDGNKVWLQLKKDGKEVDSKIVTGDMSLTAPERTYVYKDSEDYPVFYCCIDSIFRGNDAEFVVFKYAFLRDEITTIEKGDSYGIFDVEGFTVPEVMDGVDYAGSGKGTVLHTGDNALVLSSNDDITLDGGEQIDLHAGMYIKTEDTSAPCLKMSLWKKCTIKVDNKASESKPVNEDADVVVDLKEDSTTEKENTLASTQDETKVQTDDKTEVEEELAVESSVDTPGFELLFGLIGVIGASRIRK